MNDILMTFQSRSEKVDPANIHKAFFKKHFSTVYNIDNILNFKKQRTHAHSILVLAFPARSPPIRHRSELTERDWENTVQGLRKLKLRLA